MQNQEPFKGVFSNVHANREIYIIFPHIISFEWVGIKILSIIIVYNFRTSDIYERIFHIYFHFNIRELNGTRIVYIDIESGGGCALF